MAEKVCQRPDSGQESLKSKASTAQAVRVVHIANPIRVKASASEFRAVVQSHTGQKRSSHSDSLHDLSSDEIAWDSDENPQQKVPRMEDPFEYITQADNSEDVLNKRNNRDGRIRWDVQQQQTSDRVINQMFDSLESIEETVFCVSATPGELCNYYEDSRYKITN